MLIGHDASRILGAAPISTRTASGARRIVTPDGAARTGGGAFRGDGTATMVADGRSTAAAVRAVL